MRNTTKWRMIASVKTILISSILIAAIIFSMTACGEQFLKSLLSSSENENSSNINGSDENNEEDNLTGIYENIINVQGFNNENSVKFTITGLTGKSGVIGLTAACEGWNWTFENFGVIQNGQVPVYLPKFTEKVKGVPYGSYNIVLWFEKENTYHVYTAGSNINGINDAQLFEITDYNTIDFSQFRIINNPFHELNITGFETLFNKMQGWGYVFSGDDEIGWAYGIIADNSLKVTIRKLFNVRTESVSFRLRLQIWQGNYIYELSDFNPVGNSTSIHISQFVSNYHHLTVTGLDRLTGYEVSAAVYNNDGQLLNTQMGFGIISGSTGIFTLAGDFGWNDGCPLSLVLTTKGDLRQYELSDFTPAGLTTNVDISQFKRNYHQLNFTGLDVLLMDSFFHARNMRVSVYDVYGQEAAYQSYFFQLKDNIFSYILLGDFGWFEDSHFMLRLEFLNEGASDSIYELSGFNLTGSSTCLDISQFTQIL